MYFEDVQGSTCLIIVFRGAQINCRDKDKETPLMMAVRKNNKETVNVLLTRMADITVKDANDKTCLYIASEEDCADVFMVGIDFRFQEINLTV